MTAPAADGARDAAVLTAYQAAGGDMRAGIVRKVLALWHSLGSWRAEDIPGFVQRVLVIVHSGERTTAALTTAAVARTASRQGIVLPRNVPFNVAVDARNADPAEVYERPFHTVWDALADGKPFPEALKQGTDHLRTLVVSDLQLAKTHTAREVMARSDKIVGFRRVPEGAYTCALCLIACTVRYHKSVLSPMHPGCDCGVEPLTESQMEAADGRTIDPELLARIHAAAADQFGDTSTAARRINFDLNGGHETGAALYRDLIIAHDHDELGPVIGVRNKAHITSSIEDIKSGTTSAAMNSAKERKAAVDAARRRRERAARK